jgi:hypothetical protein
MTLSKIDDSIEKLSKNNQKTFLQIIADLEVEESDLNYWLEIFSELTPKINENGEQYFTNRQFSTIKKIKKFVIDEGGDANDLLRIINQKKTEKNLNNSPKTKHHYFENSVQLEDIDQNFISHSVSEKSIQIDDFITAQTLDNNSSQAICQDITNEQDHELTIDNQVDLNAKLQDFSRIKLYNIHPKINEQIQHRVKCVKLNLDELNNLLKNL